MTRPRLLDLFCGAGGAAKGYIDAGFDVLGVDVKPQPHHRCGEFLQADVMKLGPNFAEGFDAIHASPPCQAYSIATKTEYRKNHADLIGPVREMLQSTGKPYVIENVVGAPLHKSLLLCGTMFPSYGLRVIRHRYFEMNFLVPQPKCVKPHPPVFFYRSKRKKRKQDAGVTQEKDFVTVAGSNARLVNMQTAMGIDWMNKAEIVQAVPPAYTEYIGRHLLPYIEGGR